MTLNLYYTVLHCKKDNLLPAFTKPKFTIEINNYLRNKTLRQILKAELKNENIKKKLIQQLKENIIKISNNIGFAWKIVLYNKIRTLYQKKKSYRITLTTINFKNYFLKRDP